MNLIKLLHFPKPSALMTVATSALSLIAACSSTPNSNGGGAGGNDGGAANGGAGLGGEGGMAGAAGTGGAGSAGSGGMAGAGGTGGAGGAGGEGGGGPKSLYLVSIDHKASPSVLLKVDIATGVGKVACTLPSDVDPINYHSTTFSRTGVLFASNYQDARIDTIDPCTCAITPVGPTGFTSIPGITVNHGTGLFGVETTSDILLDIDTLTGNATKIGDLGVDFTTAGATWSDALNNGQGGLFGINGATNSLYSINPTTGSATVLAPINGVTFTSVGIEMHPANDTIYACTDDAVLYAIDQATGTATGIGTGMGHVSSCNNLAAPWLAVKCLDAL